MDVVAIGPSVGGNKAFRQRSAQGHFRGRHAFSDRQRRTRLKRELKAAGVLHHFYAFTPIGREVLVVEHGHAATRSFKHPDYLLKESVPRIERLTQVGFGILTVLADDHHAIDGQPTGPQRQRLGDARKDGNAMTGRRPAGQILFRELVDVQRHQIHLRFPPPSLPDIAQEKPIDEMLGMGVQANLCCNQGDLLSGRSRTLRGPDRGCQDGRSGDGTGGGEELSAGEGRVHGRVRVLSR